MSIGIMMYCGKEKLKSEMSSEDTICSRCGALEESINHVFF